MSELIIEHVFPHTPPDAASTRISFVEFDCGTGGMHVEQLSVDDNDYSTLHQTVLDFVLSDTEDWLTFILNGHEYTICELDAIEFELCLSELTFQIRNKPSSDIAVH